MQSIDEVINEAIKLQEDIISELFNHVKIDSIACSGDIIINQISQSTPASLKLLGLVPLDSWID